MLVLMPLSCVVIIQSLTIRQWVCLLFEILFLLNIYHIIDYFVFHIYSMVLFLKNSERAMVVGSDLVNRGMDYIFIHVVLGDL